MESTNFVQCFTFIVYVLCLGYWLGYWLLAWLVWKGWLQFPDNSRFGRFANKAGHSFGQFWMDARWAMLAIIIIVVSAGIGLAAYSVAIAIKFVITGVRAS